MSEFIPWPKTPRWTNEHIIITEKIDGTNAQIYIHDDLETIEVGSRTRWITPGKDTDNYGFARWVEDHKESILKLGRGHHYGEWWGQGIQRGYDQVEKKFSLFNTERPHETLPDNVQMVPVMYKGPISDEVIGECIQRLQKEGSLAAPGYMNAEGICIYMRSSRQVYKIPFNK